MMNFIVSLLVGAIPDILFYTLAIIKVKGIKEKRILLFLLIAAGYICLFMAFRFKIYLYLVFYVYIYLVLKILYKSRINDFFIITFSDTYFILVNMLCYFMISNYPVALIVNKILLFAPLIFGGDFLHNIYLEYKNLWNRHNCKQKVKSLTLRNISLVVLNVIIVITNILLYICR